MAGQQAGSCRAAAPVAAGRRRVGRGAAAGHKLARRHVLAFVYLTKLEHLAYDVLCGVSCVLC